MKILLRGGTAEITEKKSRFIATVEPVRSPEDANALIARVRKQYWDARHNCSAMVIGENGEFTRCSDDGEPAGTAGRPMLAVLTGADVTDVCVVVTRYFGGILLGTGGLVRAYSEAVRAGLAACAAAERVDGLRLRIRTDYNGIGKVQYLLGQRALPVTDTVYTDAVEIETVVPSADAPSLKSALADKTNAKAQIVLEQEVRYAIADGIPVFLDAQDR